MAIAEGEAFLDAEKAKGGALATLVDDANVRAGELEQASIQLAARVNELEQVSTRLAERVVEREQELERLRVELRRPRFGRPALADIGAGNNGHEPDVEPADIFVGLVEVEVGPLSDFAQLVGFEDAASGIGATEDISVKGFAQGRATLEMHLSEPVELLRELEERAPFEFKVRDTREGRVVLDLDSE